MSITIEDITAIGVPLLPTGCRHYQTAGFARNWEAWDALTEDKGWTERVYTIADGGATGRSKDLQLAEGHVTVFPPYEPRDALNATANSS